MSITTKSIKANEPSDLGTILLRWLIAFLVILAVSRVEAAQPNLELMGKLVNIIDLCQQWGHVSCQLE